MVEWMTDALPEEDRAKKGGAKQPIDESAVTGSWGIDEPRTWSILVHGGAGDVGADRLALHVAGCEQAARVGAEVLAKGGTAIDAVEQAVLALENDPLFNAGTGACLNADGAIELDASIMSGADLKAGGVCALPSFHNPIAIARRVMDASRHVLLAGEGAARFAIEQGFSRADESTMITENARRRWEVTRQRKAVEGWAGGTVGAVARDSSGHVAAATSTGGMVNKLVGRVGDSPILGAGNYADDESGGACSATGNGEAIMRVCFAKTVIDMLLEASAEHATRQSLAMLHARTNETAGAITVKTNGALGVARTTRTMSWAAVTDRDAASGS
jgi:L-asparaginase / beta-aspartyl-peptidase